ncbi:hypothetical protein BKA00_002481 [Actinomadura coerulea]|uniref:Uncharacterized protein n=1 Tax=Actinomadura coerulea TaxID=46159 RepID=A0A7X0KYN2_9ACTN|nr:hypothetical protein [Actinomadura coerulea]MBB6395567.1 hypothetical protein [Actinomadura coerulea]GGQ25388.1 hypothetical protein GCM10010187_47370 [Actinomadura coerulea]
MAPSIPLRGATARCGWSPKSERGYDTETAALRAGAVMLGVRSSETPRPGVAPTRLRGTATLGQTATDSVLDGTKEALPLQEIPGIDAYSGIFTLLASRSDSAVMTGTMVTADSGLGIRGIARPGGRVPAAG